MEEIRLKARAKINLTLDVTGKRENGYHELCMIMQTVGLYDEIILRKIPEDTIRLSSNVGWLPTDSRNLAWKAADLMRRTYGIAEGVSIGINKRIPVAAGLAGGSADCAAVLVGMNRLFSLGLSAKQLEEEAFMLGTDIPYCVRRGTVLAEGLGEVLTNIEPPSPFCYVVLAKPPVSVSTAKVYQALKWDQVQQHPDTEGMLEAMAEGDISQMGKRLCNVLETVTIPMHPKIAVLKEALLNLGAEGALMSGSGPTVFGLFLEREQAKRAARALRRNFAMRDVFVTQIYHVPHGKKERRKKDGRHKISYQFQ